MKTLRFLRIMLLMFFILMPCSSSAQEVNWWNDNVITAEGHGFPPSNAPNIYEARNLSKRAAIADGYRALAEQIRGVYITAETTINDGIISGDIIATNVNAVMRNADNIFVYSYSNLDYDKKLLPAASLTPQKMRRPS